MVETLKVRKDLWRSGRWILLGISLLMIAHFFFLFFRAFSGDQQVLSVSLALLYMGVGGMLLVWTTGQWQGTIYLELVLRLIEEVDQKSASASQSRAELEDL